MSKISEIIKARESGANLHFVKKDELELGTIYPIKSAIRNRGQFGEEIRVVLVETDSEGKNLAVTTSAMRTDGKPSQFAQLYDDFMAAGISFDQLGIYATESEYFGKACKTIHFAELAVAG